MYKIATAESICTLLAVEYSPSVRQIFYIKKKTLKIAQNYVVIFKTTDPIYTKINGLILSEPIMEK
jgi:hypothetical protein